MCPHTTAVYVSTSAVYMCPLKRERAELLVLRYICVFILQLLAAAIYVSSYCSCIYTTAIYVSSYHSWRCCICVLILGLHRVVARYICVLSSNTLHVSSVVIRYICVLSSYTLHVSSVVIRYVCILSISTLYLCPHRAVAGYTCVCIRELAERRVEGVCLCPRVGRLCPRVARHSLDRTP